MADERNKQMSSGRSCYRRTGDPLLATYIPESIDIMHKEPFAMVSRTNVYTGFSCKMYYTFLCCPVNIDSSLLR